MALTIGQLVGYIHADDSGMQQGLTDAELRMRGFQRDTEGRLRRLNGQFATSGELMALGLQQGTDEGRRLRSSLNRVGSVVGVLGRVAGQAGLMAMKVGAVVPVAAAVAGALVNIVPAAAVAATAILSVAQAGAAFKIGTSGIGAAIGAAFKGAGAAAGGAASGANAAAAAQQALKDATKQAAEANEEATKRVKDAEQDLSDAQKEAKAAQLALNDARKQGARDLEDLNNSLADAQLDQRDAVMDVADAEKALAEAKRSGNPQDIARAQLAYDRAVQRLKEQRIETARLQEETEKANKAGIEGTDAFREAQERIADTQRTVADRERDLAEARTDAAKTAEDGIEQIRRAQEALNQAMSGGGGGGGGGIDPFAEAMAKLAPAARAFVYAVIALKPAWDALRLDVQQRLFQGLAGDLTRTARSVLPVLRRELVDSAGGLNSMARGAMASGRELATSGTLGRAMASASAGLHNLAGVPGIVVTAFGQLAAAAGPSFERLTQAADDAAAGIGERLGNAFESGALQDAIETAIDLIGDLGEIGGNVGSIIGSIFSAAETSGGGFIGTLKEITGSLAEAFASKPVQDGLAALFDTMSLLATTAAPLLGRALGVIAPVLETLAPPLQELIKELGGDLGPLIEELGPLLVEAAVAAGTLVRGALPLVDIVVQLAVWVAQLLNAMPPGTLAVIASAWAAISLGVKAYGLYMAIASGATRAMAIATGIWNAVLLLNPIGLVIGLIVALVAAIVIAYQNSETFRKIVQDVWKAVQEAVLVAVKAILGAIDWFRELPGKMSKWFGQAKDWAIRKFLELISWLTGLPGRASSALSNLGGALRRRAVEAGLMLVNATRDKLSSAIDWIRGLPGRARSVLSGLGSALESAGRSLINGLIRGILSKFGEVRSTLGDLTSSITDWKGPEDVDKKLLTPAGRMVISGFQAGIAGQVPSLRAQLQQITRELPEMALPEYAMSGAGMGPNAPAASVGAGGGVRTVRIVVEGPEPMKRLIRGIVATDGGGSVQATFGRGKG